MSTLEDLFDREAFIQGVARGVAQFLETSGAGRQFGDLIETLAGLHLVKEGVLDADQGARLLGISRRTFDRKVAENVLPKSETLGYAEPRWLVGDLVAALVAGKVKPGHGDASADAGAGHLTVVDLGGEHPGGRPRRRKAA